jgi:hypothetical protein
MSRPSRTNFSVRICSFETVWLCPWSRTNGNPPGPIQVCSVVRVVQAVAVDGSSRSSGRARRRSPRMIPFCHLWSEVPSPH